jgi:hypothetical protein
VAARRLPLYSALAFDGRISFKPASPHDAAVVAAFGNHQRTDKGFGAALGPDAASYAATGFGRIGYALVQGRSDWVFGPGDVAIQRELAAGFAQAAREIGGLDDDRLAAWLSDRKRMIAAGRSHLSIGHVDFFAMPTAIR